MNPIADVTYAYMKAAYIPKQYFSLDDVITYTERVATSLFQHSGKAEIYHAVSVLIQMLEARDDGYYIPQDPQAPTPAEL